MPSNETIKKLCDYHGIAKKVEDQIQETTGNPYLKTTLEQMLTETTKDEEYFKEASEETGLDPDFIKAYVTSESGHTKLSNHAQSNKGAIGMAQMLITSAKEIGLKIIPPSRWDLSGSLYLYETITLTTISRGLFWPEFELSYPYRHQ